MAGRPRKSSFIKDVVDISSIETKEEVKPIEISEKPVEIAPEPSYAKTGVVKTDSWLNIRSAPSFSASVIGKLDNGERVEIYETKSGFGKISITEEKWVSLEFIV